MSFLSKLNLLQLAVVSAIGARKENNKEDVKISNQIEYGEDKFRKIVSEANVDDKKKKYC